MSNSLTFAVDIFHIICNRLLGKAADLQLLVETTSSFEEWLNWEAYLACRLWQKSEGFCEVTAKPTYASEGVQSDDDDNKTKYGDLRVGGPNNGENHCWVFAEFAILHDGTQGKWLKKIESDAEKLLRLGWKKSAALQFVVLVSRGDALTEWAYDLENNSVWNRPSLTEPFEFPLPGGGTVVVKAFDIKQNATDRLTTTTH
jgi:hypothetical protein